MMTKEEQYLAALSAASRSESAMDLVGFLYGFGLLQGLILAGVLVFAGSGQRQANAFMAGLVLVMGASLLQSWMIRTDYFINNPSLGLLIPPLDFTWGPLLYLYAYTLTNQTLHIKQLLHFLPSAVLLISVGVFVALPHEDKQSTLIYLWSQHTDPLLQEHVEKVTSPILKVWIDYHLQGNFFTLQFGIYCYLVLRQIKRHNRRMEQHFSSTDDMNLRWLRTLTLVCMIFLSIFILFNRSQLLLVGHFDVNALLPSIPYLFLVLMVYIAGIAAIFQPDLIRGVTEAMDSDPNTQDLKQSEPVADAPATQETPEQPESDDSEESDKAKNGKYERSGLSLKDAEEYKIRLMQTMQEEELYLDCELTLPELAKATGLTPHQVSQVLNGQMNQNFFSFVNNYRIQLAKEILSNPETQNMPIVELAVEVGFKSKSSFYDAFKKATQMTPTQFKKST